DTERRRKSHELSLLLSAPKRQEFVTKTNADGSHSTELRTVEDPNLENQKRNMQWDLDSLDRKIVQSRNEQKKLRDEMFDLKKEQAALEE
ncbi:MAG TPA: hypothetical protein VFV50_14660, partial [Bdellovibrionales bacterium]|nr:hypothetical protein [Bdellovibrionales bacterium]